MCIMRYRFMYVLSRFLPLSLSLGESAQSNRTQPNIKMLFVLFCLRHRLSNSHGSIFAPGLYQFYLRSPFQFLSPIPCPVYRMYYTCMCVCVCVCVQLCVQNLSASEIIIFGYLSHVMAPRRTPQSIGSSSKQLRGGRG